MKILILVVSILISCNIDQVNSQDLNTSKVNLKNDIQNYMNGYESGLVVLSQIILNSNQIAAFNNYALARSKFMLAYNPLNFSSFEKIVNTSIDEIDDDDDNSSFLSGLFSGISEVISKFRGLVELFVPASKEVIDLIENALPDDKKTEVKESSKYKLEISKFQRAAQIFDKPYKDLRDLSITDESFRNEANVLSSESKNSFETYVSAVNNGTNILYSNYRDNNNLVKTLINDTRNELYALVDACNDEDRVIELRNDLNINNSKIQRIKVQFNNLHDIILKYQGNRPPNIHDIDRTNLVHRSFNQIIFFKNIVDETFRNMNSMDKTLYTQYDQTLDDIKSSQAICNTLLTQFEKDDLFQVSRSSISIFERYNNFRF